MDYHIIIVERRVNTGGGRKSPQEIRCTLVHTLPVRIIVAGSSWSRNDWMGCWCVVVDFDVSVDVSDSARFSVSVSDSVSVSVSNCVGVNINVRVSASISVSISVAG